MSRPSSSAPPVSVLLSCYNGARWLREAIGSVLGQTHGDFEFIVVDDGSKDDTLDIVRSYSSSDNRIVVAPKRNTGLADSLNYGLSLARGTWIARVDQDDLCEPDRLQKQLAYVRAHPDVVLLGTGFEEIDAAGSVIATHSYPAAHRRLVSRLERIRGFFPHSSAFYLAEAARKVGGYNTRISRAEDWRLWLELSLQGKISCLPEPLVRIRKHPGQMSLDASGVRQFSDACAAAACHLLRRNGYPDPSISPDQKDWDRFLSWVDARIAGDGALARLNAWGQARNEYFSGPGGMAGAWRFGWRLLQSGHAMSIIREKLFGLALPAKLARDWASTSGRN